MSLYPETNPSKMLPIAKSHEELKSTRRDKAMTPEQFTQVVEAIVEGKYSWACVLILRFADYNPLHYIPYRTYKRLLKENGRKAKAERQALTTPQNEQNSRTLTLHSESVPMVIPSALRN
jgi:hypothetical protein